MSVGLHSTIEGLQKAQAQNARRIAALKPSGAAGKAMQFMTSGLARYATIITHVDTGAWRAAHRMRLDLSGRVMTGEVFIDPNAVNPKSNVLVTEYAGFWEEQGGEMAVYQRTVAEAGERLIRAGILMLQGNVNL